MPFIVPGSGGGGGGRELGYDQITANVTVVSTTEATPTTIISCAAHTFDGTVVMVDVFFPTCTITNGNVVIALWEGASELTRLWFAQNGNAAVVATGVRASYRFTPTAASHTYTIAASGSNSPVLFAGPGNGATAYPPAYARFSAVT